MFFYFFIAVRKIIRKKIKSRNSQSHVLNRIVDNNAITIKKISKKQENCTESPHEPSDTKDSSTQEVRHIKPEIIDVNEFPERETSEFSDYDNTTFIDDKSANEIFFAETINFEAAYSESTSLEEMNDSVQLSDLIDFTCTKCRKTFKNPDYFLQKTDLQCSDCQTTMKFQCPSCKLLFRKFDSAVRHAKQSCPVGESSPPAGIRYQASPRSDIRKCLSCGFRAESFIEFRNHIRDEHPDDDATKCKLCLKPYKNRESLLKHMRTCGQSPKIVCVFCGYRTKRQEHLRMHMRHKHPDPESCHGGGYECPKCNKKYKYLLPMKSHLKICGTKKVEEINTVVESIREEAFVGEEEEDEAETILGIAE